MSFRSGRLQAIDTMFVPRFDEDLEAQLRGLVDSRRVVPQCQPWAIEQYSQQPCSTGLSNPPVDSKCIKMQHRCVEVNRVDPFPISTKQVRTLEPFPQGGVGTRPKSAGHHECYRPY